MQASISAMLATYPLSSCVSLPSGVRRGALSSIKVTPQSANFRRRLLSGPQQQVGRAFRVYCAENEGESAGDVLQEIKEQKETPKRQADSTDAIASYLSRRYGLAGGLLWVGVLLFGVVSEQLKTRSEVSSAKRKTRDVKETQEVMLGNGLRVTDLRLGGGDYPRDGDFVVVAFTAKVEGGEQIFSTNDSGRPIAFIYGSRTVGALCPGALQALAQMRQGGKRRVVVPPELAFGEYGTILDNDVRVPGNATIEYDIELQRVSIAPS